jgi:hypothetical protein
LQSLRLIQKEDAELLRGWEEIAGVLKISVRTAQRYEWSSVPPLPYSIILRSAKLIMRKNKHFILYLLSCINITHFDFYSFVLLAINHQTAVRSQNSTKDRFKNIGFKISQKNEV